MCILCHEHIVLRQLLRRSVNSPYNVVNSRLVYLDLQIMLVSWGCTNVVMMSRFYSGYLELSMALRHVEKTCMRA